MPNYTNQATIEAYIKRSLTTDEETLLSLYLDSVDAFIDSELVTGFGEVTATTRYYDGEGTKILDIDPCMNINSIKWVDELEQTNYIYLNDQDYEARPRNGNIKTWLESRIGRFPNGVANIAVNAEFTRGTTTPSDIKLAATILIAKLLEKRDTGELQSESIEGYSYRVKEFAMESDEITFILDQYLESNTFI